ncbi:MAG: class I SAM-dependent methyltransferase [Acidimicrobiia bacterium]|nr:class I SAM-dependent methyltransferase [Acidimicrobiia bacterium]
MPAKPTMLEIFERNEGRLIHKWMHYFEIYERHFAPFRGEAPRVLEIGVSHGGSLDMLREWFGRGTSIVGVDIDPRIVDLRRRNVHLEVGDQGDVDFLAGVVERHGPFDIVIDDGSHRPRHQIASLETLWPTMAPPSVYLVEDTHANYWAEYEGAPGDASTFIEYAKRLADDLHAFHSQTPGFEPTDWTRTLGGLHFYDSIVVLDRVDREPPYHRKSGRPVFGTLYAKDVAANLDEEHLAAMASMNRPSHRLWRLVRHPIMTWENRQQRRRTARRTTG